MALHWRLVVARLDATKAVMRTRQRAVLAALLARYRKVQNACLCNVILACNSCIFQPSQHLLPSEILRLSAVVGAVQSEGAGLVCVPTIPAPQWLTGKEAARAQQRGSGSGCRRGGAHA